VDKNDALVGAIRFDGNGLVTAIVQDAESSEVLMVAYMNEESLRITLDGGKACYWSRSRQKLWLKGESSGHVQLVKEIRIDCDGDAIVLKVAQTSGACHTGYRSCFYRKLDPETGELVIDGVLTFDPDEVYK
jgi:phosphoribosyl-AMP cyclohydrolase